MPEKCSKCGNELSPEWVVCPICKKKIQIQQGDKTKNEYSQEKIERIEKIKRISEPFNERYFSPVFLMAVIFYIFTVPLTGPLFGFFIPLITILASVLIIFTTVYYLSSFKLSRIRK